MATLAAISPFEGRLTRRNALDAFCIAPEAVALNVAERNCTLNGEEQRGITGERAAAPQQRSLRREEEGVELDDALGER